LTLPASTVEATRQSLLRAAHCVATDLVARSVRRTETVRDFCYWMPTTHMSGGDAEQSWLLWQDFPFMIEGIFSFRHVVSVRLALDGSLVRRADELTSVLKANPARDDSLGYAGFQYGEEGSRTYSANVIAHDNNLMRHLLRFQRYAAPG
jgi:hypothetical protein